MGAKTPANVKEKRTVLTCEVCQMEFLNVHALKSHAIEKHPNDKHMQSSETENKDEKKTAFVPPTSRVSRRLQQKKSVENETVSEDSSSSNVPDRKKVVFECPQCFKVFPVYFSAQKHIQKYHCQDKDGNHGSPDLLNVIKPVRKEMSTMCDKLVHGTGHRCGDFPSRLGKPHDNGKYSCLGCKNTFLSVNAFNKHVAGAHNENVDILIFENLNEFLVWKNKIESQVHVKYLTLNNSAKMQYFQCNYVSPKNSADITHLCPSVMIVRDFSNGLHIRYFKDHHGHETKPKQELDKDDVFNSLLNKDDENDNDLYIKFKTILQHIAIGAAKINVINLKKLYSTALQMQTCLNSYEDIQKNAKTLKMRTSLNSQDSTEKKSFDSMNTDNQEKTTTEDSISKSLVKETDKTMNKSIDDDQITKALQATRASTRLKRKSQTSPVPVAKKQKADADKNVNEIKPDLKENNSKTKDVKFDSPKVTKLPPITQSPSFNDTYKKFIDSTLKTKKSSPSTKRVAKKGIMKTKMGQFSPKKTVQIQHDSENVESMGKKKKKTAITSPQTSITNLKQESSEHVDSVDINKKKTPVKSPQSPASLNPQHVLQSPKRTVQMKVTSQPIERVYKKKKAAPIRSSYTSIADINLEQIKYEVVEQENDCNILVLKI